MYVYPLPTPFIFVPILIKNKHECAKVKLLFFKLLFFGSDGTSTARYRMDNIQVLFYLKKLWTTYFLTEKFLPGSHLLFGDVAHIIMEHHRLGTKRLEELAMEVVLRNNIALDCVSTVVLENATNGFYNPDGKVPENLTDDGKELFQQLKIVFGKLKTSLRPETT